MVLHVLRAEKSRDAALAPITRLSHYVPVYEFSTTWANEGEENMSLHPNYFAPHKELGSHVFFAHNLPSMLPLHHDDSQTKVTYLSRNARDVVTSLYYHKRNELLPPPPGTTEIDPPPVPPFEDFVADFCAGNLVYDSWIEHTMD